MANTLKKLFDDKQLNIKHGTTKKQLKRIGLTRYKFKGKTYYLFEGNLSMLWELPTAKIA